MSLKANEWLQPPTECVVLVVIYSHRTSDEKNEMLIANLQLCRGREKKRWKINYSQWTHQHPLGAIGADRFADSGFITRLAAYFIFLFAFVFSVATENLLRDVRASTGLSTTATATCVIASTRPDKKFYEVRGDS